MKICEALRNALADPEEDLVLKLVHEALTEGT